jgi:hypothetical protein
VQDWYAYGQGVVSADGRQIVPDPGVQFLWVTCIFLSQTPSYPAQTNPPTVRGDPVDVSTGLYTMDTRRGVTSTTRRPPPLSVSLIRWHYAWLVYTRFGSARVRPGLV